MSSIDTDDPVHWSIYYGTKGRWVNTLRPRHNGRHFPDDIFKWIFLNENVWISINISLKFVPRGLINNIRTLVQVMAWRRPGDKPLSQPMMVRLPTHIYVTRPQWVKGLMLKIYNFIASTLKLNCLLHRPSDWFIVKIKTLSVSFTYNYHLLLVTASTHSRSNFSAQRL